jgi:hypothetical protein
VTENADRSADFGAITAPTILIDGTATRPYLRRAVETLIAVMPQAEHIALPGQGHSATGNRSERGHPEAVSAPAGTFLHVNGANDPGR